jgi:hypothetical protein
VDVSLARILSDHPARVNKKYIFICVHNLKAAKAEIATEAPDAGEGRSAHRERR